MILLGVLYNALSTIIAALWRLQRLYEAFSNRDERSGEVPFLIDAIRIPNVSDCRDVLRKLDRNYNFDSKRIVVDLYSLNDYDDFLSQVSNYWSLFCFIKSLQYIICNLLRKKICYKLIACIAHQNTDYISLVRYPSWIKWVKLFFIDSLQIVFFFFFR